MQRKNKYKTKQKDELIEFFESHSGQHATASDVCDYFKEKNVAIGKATIYRQLDQLVQERVISKYYIDTNTPACFEYVGETSNEKVCFHCKCEKCGKLIHLHCDEMVEIQHHLFKDHHFVLDANRTVLYGLCETCGGKNG